MNFGIEFAYKTWSNTFIFQSKHTTREVNDKLSILVSTLPPEIAPSMNLLLTGSDEVDVKFVNDTVRPELYKIKEKRAEQIREMKTVVFNKTEILEKVSYVW